MAVMTFTRRQVVDMLPEFLTKRLATFTAEADAHAKRYGVTRATVGTLNAALALREGDVVRLERYRWRSPYAVKRPALEQGWQEAVAAGFAEVVPGGWKMHPRGVELGIEASRLVRAHLRSLDVPKEPTRRAAEQLEHLAQRVPPGAARTALIRGLRSLAANEPPSDLVAASLAALDLWTFRDDSHIAAWQARGYEGPAFNTLSYVWSSPPDVSWTKIGGNATIDDLAKALAPLQDRTDVERNVDALVRRGDLERDGDTVRLTPQGQRTRDEVEEDTDRRYFAIWDLDDAATARLGGDLRAVIDALPKAP